MVNRRILMKYFAVLVILVGLAFPAFSQNNALNQRFTALGDSMNKTITNSTSTLSDFDSQIKDNGDIRMYTTYLIKYNYYAKALQDSEGKLNLMFRSNDRTAFIKDERDNYEGLIKQLQAVKTDYDAYLKTR
jgi:hypothetical protein